MRCPACNANDTKVIDSRATEGGGAIRRRRMCLKCDRRFTTKERVEEELRLSVLKLSGARVPYQREKIFNGVRRACIKLPIADEAVQALVDQVEQDIFQNHEREVTTQQIGLYVGRHLRRLSPVAYVRFMSVHRKFANIDEFVDEIQEVRQRVAREDPSQQSLFET